MEWDSILQQGRLVLSGRQAGRQAGRDWDIETAGFASKDRSTRGLDRIDRHPYVLYEFMNPRFSPLIVPVVISSSCLASISIFFFSS